MLYRPNFCCHCGEKVARSRWTPLTSRRFCEFCEVEQKQHDLLPRAGAVAALLIGAAGLVTYIGGSGSTHPSSERQPIQKVRELRSEPGKPAANQVAIATEQAESTNGTVPVSNLDTAIPKQRETRAISSTEQVHYCGAITRKGTPCTRRVKTKGRCWQHSDKASSTVEDQN